MGERKVLNKYFPPDFDPAKLPRGKRGKNNEMKVRMMLPMSVRCNTCGNFMYKGTKFNTRKEDVQGETYLGLAIFRFYYRCSKCAAEFTMKTDPKSADYVMEEGATRNYEPWRDKDLAVADAVAAREEEERGNAMKALENRTLDSKREMDLLATLDEMKSLNARHQGITTEQALAALQREASGEGAGAAGEEELPEEDQAAMAQFFAQQSTILRLLSDSDEEENGQRRAAANGARGGGATGSGGVGNGGASSSKAVEGAGVFEQQRASSGAGASTSQAAKPASGGSSAPAAAPAAPKAVIRPLVKVVAKPKRPAAAVAPAAQQQQAAPPAKRIKAGDGADGSESPPGDGGGLLGLVSYGSDDSD